MNYVFVTGMFRSGTTLIARMLNTHSKIACASDPMRPILNSFRYAVADSDYKKRHERFDPLGDYFLSDMDLLERILGSDLSIALDEDATLLLGAVRKRAVQFSKLWADSLNLDLDPHTYKGFVSFCLEHINRVYGRGKDIAVTAFKEVWCNEFVPAFFRTFRDSKAIIIIRDPRAITASNIASGAKYPQFFLARQWRKLAFLTEYLKEYFGENVHLIKYESLVKDPEREVQDLMDFIGLEFEEELLDLGKYLDGENKPWKQNTNFDYRTKQFINTDSLERWRHVLEEKDLSTMELIAGDWMQHFGYEGVLSKDIFAEFHLSDFRRWPTNELSEWIKPYSFDEYDDIYSTQVTIEKLRMIAVINNARFTAEERFALQIKEDK